MPYLPTLERFNDGKLSAARGNRDGISPPFRREGLEQIAVMKSSWKKELHGAHTVPLKNAELYFCLFDGLSV